MDEVNKLSLSEVNKKYPTISAIINIHNAEEVREYLPRALRSIQKQRPGVSWEAIVVCDGPAEGDLIKIVQKFVTPHKGGDKLLRRPDVPFTFFGTEYASGYQCAPKNKAICIAKGEYIAFLDYDNEWHKDHLKVLWEAMDEGKVWPDFTYGRRQYVRDESCPEEVTMPTKDKEGNEIKITIREGKTPLVEWNPENFHIMGQSPLNGFIDTSEFLMAKGAYWRMQQATGKMWNEDMRRFGDWEMIVRGGAYAGLRGKAVDKVVQKYHWTGKNLQLTRPVNEIPEKEAI